MVKTVCEGNITIKNEDIKKCFEIDFEKLHATFDSSVKNISTKSEDIKKCFDKIDFEISIHGAFIPYAKIAEKLNSK